MIYQKAGRHLINEALQFNQFKGMNKVLKVFLIIGLIPLMISTMVPLFAYYILLFFYKGFTSPIEVLHKMVRDEAKEVKHASQFAIYWLVFPFIFFLYVLKSMTAIIFYFIWFFLILNTYLLTLGGIRFQPFLMDVDLEEDKKVYQAPSKLSVLFFTVILIFFELLWVLSALGAIEGIYPLSIIGIYFMLYLINPILFMRKSLKVSKNEEEVEDEIKSEEA